MKRFHANKGFGQDVLKSDKKPDKKLWIDLEVFTNNQGKYCVGTTKHPKINHVYIVYSTVTAWPGFYGVNFEGMDSEDFSKTLVNHKRFKPDYGQERKKTPARPLKVRFWVGE